MELFFISFIVISLAVIGMAAGILLGRSSLKGSCGGISQLQGFEGDCMMCSNRERCEQRRSGLS